MIEVVSVYTPHPTHEKFQDFLTMLRLQKRTAEKFGHRHLVVSDQDLAGEGLNVIRAELPTSLMQAIVVGQMVYLREHWDGEHSAVLVDADCLIARNLAQAFGDWHLGLTNRDDDRSPVNNGAMYVNGNKPAVLNFFEKVLHFTKNHWGGDQEAVSKAAAPVPRASHYVEERSMGLMLAFLEMRSHNVIPREPGLRHKSNPFIVHFKGTERKAWMRTYAERFIL